MTPRSSLAGGAGGLDRLPPAALAAVRQIAEELTVAPGRFSALQRPLPEF